MSHIEAIDLQTPERLVLLHAEAKRQGFVTDSEADRLKFFAAAEHARAKGTINIPGLFATVIRQGLWKHISQRDEDAARAKLRNTALRISLEPSRRNRKSKSDEVMSDEAERAEIRALIVRSLESVESHPRHRRDRVVQTLGICR